MQPQIGLRFLVEGAGGFVNADFIVKEAEARKIIQDWVNGGRTGILRNESGAWAIQLDVVRGIFTFSLTPPPGTPNGPQRPFPGSFVSGN